MPRKVLSRKTGEPLAELQDTVRLALAKCEVSNLERQRREDAEKVEVKDIPAKITRKLQKEIEKLQKATTPSARIPHWWWTPIDDSTFLANTHWAEGFNYTEDWRPAIVIDALFERAWWDLTRDYNFHPLAAQAVVADFMGSVLGGPLYPHRGVVAFLKEWLDEPACAVA